MTFLKCFLAFILLQSVTWANCESGEHHIFLLHGIGGSKATFGALEAILSKQSPCYKARTFEYKTGSLETPHDFAKDFHAYVSGLSLRSSDKISLVMHSQGGLVGTLWLKFLKENNLPQLKQLDSFITLSTPFWGTNIANVGKKLFYSLPPGMINPISPFGRNELNEMSYGSATIKTFVESFDEIFSGVGNLRPLIIGGMKRIHNETMGEDDIVVPIHSMQPKRFYLKDNLNFFDKPSRVPASVFKTSDEKPFHIVAADHIRIDQYGIAEIPYNCLENLSCDHPSLLPIIEHLKGNEVKPLKKFSLSRFRVTLFINNHHDINYEKKDVTIVVHGFDKTIRIPLIERLTPRGGANYKEGLAFSFAGISKKAGSQRLLVTLKYKNKAIKTYEVPVEAGLSSFIDADLAALN